MTTKLFFWQRKEEVRPHACQEHISQLLHMVGPSWSLCSWHFSWCASIPAKLMLMVNGTVCTCTGHTLISQTWDLSMALMLPSNNHNMLSSSNQIYIYIYIYIYFCCKCNLLEMGWPFSSCWVNFLIIGNCR